MPSPSPKSFILRILLPYPSVPDRIALLRRALRDVPNALSPQQLDHVAFSTEGLTGADIFDLAQVVEMRALVKCQKAKWFRRVIPRTPPPPLLTLRAVVG
jgi:SpoVK/Ycf46/Vps4 family AAA+-type ATPase